MKQLFHGTDSAKQGGHFHIHCFHIGTTSSKFDSTSCYRLKVRLNDPIGTLFDSTETIIVSRYN